jgi:hypothetical protein
MKQQYNWMNICLEGTTFTKGTDEEAMKALREET